MGTVDLTDISKIEVSNGSTLDKIIQQAIYDFSMTKPYYQFSSTITNQEIISFVFNEVRYQLLIEKVNGKWKPRYVYHIMCGAGCELCEDGSIGCSGFEERIDELYKLIEPEIRLQLLYK